MNFKDYLDHFFPEYSYNAAEIIKNYYPNDPEDALKNFSKDSFNKLIMSDSNVLSWLAWAFADFKSDLNYKQMLNFLKNEGKHSNESFIREKNPEQHLPTGRKVIFDVYTEISERKKVDTNEDSDEKTSDVKETIITYFDIENNSDGSHLREDMARGFIYGCNILVRSNGEAYTADKYSDASPVNVLWVFLSGAKMRENSVTVYSKYETECIFAEEGNRKDYPMPELNLIRIIDVFIGHFNKNLINEGNTDRQKERIGLALLDLLFGQNLKVDDRLKYLDKFFGISTVEFNQEVLQMNLALEIMDDYRRRFEPQIEELKNEVQMKDHENKELKEELESQRKEFDREINRLKQKLEQSKKTSDC